MGLSATLEIGKQTLLDTQTRIQTTSNNISNADNTSYHRQVVTSVSNPASRSVYNHQWIGTGSQITTISQTKDDYIEQRLSAATSDQSAQDTTVSYLTQASSYITGSSTSSNMLDTYVGKFFDTWDSASQDPNSSSTLSSLKGAATNLISYITDTTSNLTGVDTNIQSSISDNANSADTLLKQISTLNTEITQSEGNGSSTANDLRDLRYDSLMKLSAIMPISYSEDSSGALTVSLTGTGLPQTDLVTPTGYSEIQYDTVGKTFSVKDGTGTNPSATPLANGYFSSGKIGGLLDSSTKINNYMTSLNTFSSNFYSQVNTAAGYTVFDTTTTPVSVANFTVNAGTVANVAGLQDQTIAALGGTFSDYTSTFYEQVGSDLSNAETQLDYQNTLKSDLTTQQQSVSGVSVDEEMVDMIKNQQLYQAAAKVVSMTSDMMTTVINMVK